MNSTTPTQHQTVWNDYAETFATFLEKSSLQLGLSISRMFNLSSPKSILEVGCGSGLLALYLSQRLPPGSTYTAVDISDNMIQMAQKNQDEVKNKIENVDLRFIKADGADLSFTPSESVDVYISCLCYDIVPDVNKLFNEAMRVLRKGGKIGIGVPGRMEKCEIITIFSDRCKELGIEIPEHSNAVYLGERENLIKKAQEHGVGVDFCWTETLAFTMFEENEVEIAAKIPGNVQIMGQIGEEMREKVIEAMKREFKEKKKAFSPLQAELLLLVGRK